MATALQELLAKRRAESDERSAPVSGQGPLPVTGTAPDQQEVSDSPMPVSEPDEKDKPYGVAQVVTPSGIEIYFQAGPKRLYRLRKWDAIKTMIDPDWDEVPSMSDIKDILDKPALPWWGMKIGVAGVLQLVQDGKLEKHNLVLDDVDFIVKKLTAEKLTVNHQRDKAADRGTNVHKCLEAWAEGGTMPIADVYPPHERGYVQGVVEFLRDSGAEPVASEVMVGSLEMGFAGRFDLIAEIPNGVHVFVHRTDKGRGDRSEPIQGGTWLLDLKTSKDVYPSHHLQCAGYELAYQESYGKSTDHQGVIQVSEDGRYKLVKSRATVHHFVNLKWVYDGLKEIG